ncbi:DNA uptake protein [Halobacteroides halobius DSM 5150]|uniref:DNA uptake protein n=1 Tax=Halobacteroides halobius (strain ATCC 35273 / DSM 5150 / MD-1) TaxID=748449 RepID=L0K7H2_HALHC|nr:helix-hairpin-helix domain-containing protein [Halobacteroides halobius]AGB40495.1 DNA uptake protein [Halobacteroides halobius DSM 5150]
MTKKEEGYILIFVFITLTSLGILLPVLLQLVSNEVIITKHYQQQIKNYYLVKGVMVVAKEEVSKQINKLSYISKENLDQLQIEGSIVLKDPNSSHQIKTEYLVKEIVDESSKLNLNLASQERLEELPEIGETISQRIVDHRLYNYLEELLNLSGIDNKLYEQIKDYLTLKTQGKINLNTAPIEVLNTLPGVGETLATRIIMNRIFTNIEELKDVEGVGPATYQQLEPLVKVDSNYFQILVRIKIPERELQTERLKIIKLD